MSEHNLLISPLPQGWANRKFSEICDRVSESYSPKPGGSTPYIGLEHLAQGFPACIGCGVESDVKSGKSAFKQGDILFGKLRPYLRKGALAEFDGVCSTDILAFRAKAGIDAEFIKFLIHSDQFIGHAKATTTGVQHPRTSWSSLSEFSLSVPPLSEQKVIAYTLSTVQRAIEAQERIIQTTTELKKALMQKLFTEGLRGEAQKETEIGLVPESWEVVPLGDIAKVGNGSTPKRSNVAYWDRGTIPWLNSSKIHDLQITEADQFVTQVAIKDCHLPIVKANSLLIAITGQGKTLGNSAICRIDTCINQHLAYAQFCHPEINPDYILWYMQTRYEYLRSIAHGGGSTKGALTCGFLKTILIPLPANGEQLEITSIFQYIERKLNTSKSRKRRLEELLRTLLRSLISAEIRINTIAPTSF